MVGDRPVARCGFCGIVQYRTAAEVCRRCCKSLSLMDFLDKTLGPSWKLGNSKTIVSLSASAQKARSAMVAVQALGVEIKKLRNHRGLALRDLDKINDAAYFSKLENGLMVPGLNKLEEIAEFFEVPMRTFFVNNNYSQEAIKTDAFVEEVASLYKLVPWSKWPKIIQAMKKLTIRNVEAEVVRNQLTKKYLGADA